ncbi:uncharacterized protein SOCEGT47_001560 [Sorangium cellulosum]|uniref:DUF11 domain-containing protein n=1 Tax=Sorangium cellulosum TaxID=56 RepID=A0A4P2PT17_SORCE|nr:DUF11 domain-containing protein [Sorangium cellulosum]AUX19704.1 uncharacterized protein SOCEGT47_001560 [Sorangium cellulosum]
MKRRLIIGGLVGLAWVGGPGGAAHAAPVMHVEVSQRGDFLLIGNTLGYECGGDLEPATPVVGNADPEQCGSTGLGDSAPDVYWRADSPEDGQAEANTTITASEARSTAWLEVPAGATVTHAYLYWGAHISPGEPVDTTVTLDRPGASGFSEEVHAVAPLGGSFTPDEDPTTTEYYQSFADVTAIVQAHGTGAYRVGGVHSKDFAASGTSFDHNNFAGWWMVVFYQLASEPPRHLALFHGLDRVNTPPAGQPDQGVTATLSGFVVPNAGYDAKIGMITFEGDASIDGDRFLFNDEVLENTLNPADNFFNGTRSYLGIPVSTVGDLPQMRGLPGAMAGIDMDVLDITDMVSAGQTSAPIEAATDGDLYFLAGFVTSISTFKPDFTSSTKTAVDVNGEPLLAGDVLRYTVEVVNTGNDASVDTVLTDPLPPGVTYVPGSLAIESGPNAGAMTDAAGDDQGEYDAATRTVRVRLGEGANADEGGTLAAVTGATTVTFQVTVDAGAEGLISNQAIVTAAGEQGSPAEETPTDGNGPAGGVPPTDVVVDDCATDAQCAAPTPYCQTETTPNACVECLTDAHCGPLAPQCDPDANACVCVPEATDACGDGIDNDCNGVIDNGCDTDEDGIEDPDEIAAGTDPNDADSDDDGVPDGDEPRFDEDTDGDGLINALDPDSDNDGLYDGTELGLPCDHEATSAAAGHCRADADEGATKTDPLDADSDDGGVPDGQEDVDLDGAIDDGETDPNNGDDDGTPADTDGDGLSDGLEETLGSDPNDADTDDDGVIDGQEPNPADDTDGDGLINVLDVDSDNDGLFDGTELGLPCDHAATNAAAGHCRADADEGATTTSALDPDTDDGGVPDGQEDINLDGAIDGASPIRTTGPTTRRSTTATATA